MNSSSFELNSANSKKKYMTTNELTLEFKNHLITYLNLLDISIDDIKDDEPLFGGDLG